MKKYKHLVAKLINGKLIVEAEGEMFNFADKENELKLYNHFEDNCFDTFDVTDCVEIKVGGRTETKSGGWDEYYAYFKDPVEESQEELWESTRNIKEILWSKIKAELMNQFEIKRKK